MVIITVCLPNNLKLEKMHNDNCPECQKEREQFFDSFESDIPYIQIKTTKDVVVRKFAADTPSHLLKWHADEEDRIVTVFEKTDWKFQFDNELPIEFKPNRFINIPEGRIHRIIKGSGDLIVEIKML